MTRKQASVRSEERKNLPPKTRLDILTEAGYRCAVPTCRGILALDMHHIWEVTAGGGDQIANLIALCPTCHQLYHRGTIRKDSIYTWKAMLVAMNGAFDREAIDKLLFLEKCDTHYGLVAARNEGIVLGGDSYGKDFLVISGDGLLHFSRLIAAGLAAMTLKAKEVDELVTYSVKLSDKGRKLVHAWKAGDRVALQNALTPAADETEGDG